MNLTPWKWNFIWKLLLPPRVLHFLWVLLHNRLLTNVGRAARGMTTDLTCGRCMAGQEDEDHVFRTCSSSSRIWEDISTSVTKSASYNSEWESWLFENLKCTFLIGGRIPSYLLFVVTLWFIWKWRCEKVFDVNFTIPPSPGKIVMQYVESWLDANAKLEDSYPKKSCMLSWTAPPPGWVKLNVDGSRISDSGFIAAGGIIRNERKSWLVGFALNKGSGDVIEAELWGIFEGLNLAWKAGFRKVEVESDSMYAVRLLSNDTPLNHPLFNIISDCKTILQREWTCTLRHTFKECNRTADSLAKLGHLLHLGMSVFEDPPAQISAVMEEDSRGLASSRIIPSL
ncbi:hypothetical protein LWI29_005964 [Acer saccharum]|uniref:RNase H type-1 domain-containing protein n=1 Tax=Acer saccharum TaxID=4024 RepID=A0AA39TCC7_ACESA|nr:hypothetical protein LWI29_005964 [Acer saccharum]